MPPIIIPIGSNPLVNIINALIQGSDGPQGVPTDSGSSSSGSGGISGSSGSSSGNKTQSTPPMSMITLPASMDTFDGLTLIA